MFSREVEELYSAEVDPKNRFSDAYLHNQSALLFLLKSQSVRTFLLACSREPDILRSGFIENSKSLKTLSITEALQRAALRLRAANSPSVLMASDVLLSVFESRSTADSTTLIDAGISREMVLKHFELNG